MLHVATLLFALMIAMAMAVPAKAQKFQVGYQAEDKKSGIDIGIIGADRSPRCKAEGNCPWRILWGSSKIKGRSKVEITVMFQNEPNGELLSSVAFPNPLSTDKTIHDPIFTIPFSQVKAIRVEVVSPKGKTVRAQFQ